MTNRVPQKKNYRFCNRKWKRKTEEGVGGRRRDKRQRKEGEREEDCQDRRGEGKGEKEPNVHLSLGSLCKLASI